MTAASPTPVVPAIYPVRRFRHDGGISDHISVDDHLVERRNMDIQATSQLVDRGPRIDESTGCERTIRAWTKVEKWRTKGGCSTARSIFSMPPASPS